MTPPALTSLTDDELIFRNSVYEFADRDVRPLVRQMDDEAKMPRSLIERLFELGVMGIEIPDEHGGSGGTFFHSVLAVEALSRVDPSVGVLVDVHNTLVINALLRWGTICRTGRYLPRLAQRTVGAYALSEAGSGSDAFALTTRATAQGDGYLLNGRKLWITNGNEADLFIVFANVNPDAGYRGHHRLPDRARLPRLRGRQEGGQARHPRQQHLRADPRGLRRHGRTRARRGGQGYKIAIETLNEGRIGIGAQMLGLAQGALDHAIAYAKERKQFGKRDLVVPGCAVPAGPGGDGDRGRTAPGLQRRAPSRREAAVSPGSGHGQALRIRGRRACDARSP